jgi:hypothetical protein
MFSKLAKLNAKSDPEIGRVNESLKCEFNIIVETTSESVVACATRMLLQQRPYYCRHINNNNISITA